MNTVIITGISGQDGLYLSKLLLSKGYAVIGTVRSIRSLKKENFKYLGILDKITIEEVDLSDIINVIKLIRKYQPDEIYNLAAQSSVGLSFEQPIGTFSFNTLSVNNLLESIRLFKPDAKFYQASSSEMFGNADEMPITLSTPKKPVSPYGVSKMAAYYMVTTYRDSYGIYAVNGILFNHESYLRGNNFFVKKIIQEAIKIKKGIVNHLNVGNLNIKRDFGFAPKYVEAMWKMMLQEKPKDLIICSGSSVLLKDVVYHIFEYLNLDIDVINVDSSLYRPNEIEEIYGDNTLSKQILNWNYDLTFFEVLDILIEEEIENFRN